MFTKTAVKYGRVTVETIDFWKSVPFTWNRSTNRVELAQGTGRRSLWFFNMAAHVAHLIFLLARYISMNIVDKDSAPASARIYTEYAVIAYSMPVAFQVAIFLRLEDLQNFINQYTEFYNQIEEKIHQKLTVGDECDRLLKFMMRSGKLICWVNLLVMFRRPARPVLITSILPSPTSLRVWEIFPWSLPHVYIWWTMWSVMHLLAIHLVSYVFAVIADVSALENLVVMDRKEKINILQTFRALQIMHLKMDSAIGLNIASHQIFFVLLIVRSLYGAVTQVGEVRFLQALVGMSAWLYLEIAFKALGQIHVASESALDRWKIWSGDVLIRCYLRSSRPIKVRIAGLYHVDRRMCLTMGAIILDSTVNMLIAEE